MPPSSMASSGCRPGTLYLVGAGPGDPGLITCRGVECLRRADLVLYDYLVNPALLHFAEKAEKVSLGHHSLQRCMTQEEINRRVRDAVAAGKEVVRLKSGDPCIFGRTADEAELLRQEGIPVVVVPGVTAGLAVSAYANIPLTHADHASAVAIVTGQQSTTHDVRPLDYRQLAAFPGPLIVYMGVRSADKWSRDLLAAGKAPDTPVAIVRRCSWNTQTTVNTRLDELPQAIARQNIRPPAVIVVGEVAAYASPANWFTGRPLFGQTVMITRPEHQSHELRELLQEQGANVIEQPAISIEPPEDWSAVDRTIEALGQFDAVAFSSANGVRFFLDRLLALGEDVRALGTARLAAIGPGTAAALAEYRLRADLLPDTYRAESLAQAIIGRLSGGRVLLIRASRGRETLAEMLTAAGFQVEQVVAYRSRDVEAAAVDIAEQLRRGAIDWITVTSSAIARALVRMFSEDLHRAKLASISPITSATLRELGHWPALEAREYTMGGLVEVLAEHARGADRKE